MWRYCEACSNILERLRPNSFEYSFEKRISTERSLVFAPLSRIRATILSRIYTVLSHSRHNSLSYLHCSLVFAPQFSLVFTLFSRIRTATLCNPEQNTRSRKISLYNSLQKSKKFCEFKQNVFYMNLYLACLFIYVCLDKIVRQNIVSVSAYKISFRTNFEYMCVNVKQL